MNWGMTMFLMNSPFFAHRRVWVTSLATLALVGTALAQPSQKPLLSRDGGGVSPNIMLTMDDSGSMTWSHMPENTVYVGAYTVPHPIPSSRGTRMDPGESSESVVNHLGVVAAQRGSSNYRQKLVRSPDTNTVYYNPEVRYWPWALATYPLPAATATNPAGRKANSPVAAAYLDPMDPTGGGTINLTSVRSVDTTWCFAGTSSSCASASVSYDPGLYFRLKKSAAGAYMDPTVADNYTEYSINREASFPKVAARTDCSGAIGPTGCSQVQERQNFANWFTYYRTRNLLARGALLEAFVPYAQTSDAPVSFRLGWGRINDSSSTSIDGVSTTVIQAGVRDFTPTIKANLYNWLYALPASGGTPLPGAMRAVGRYYSRSDAKGPWSDTPGTARINPDKTCRRAYHIMVTDGYWNADTTSVGNSDNTNGSVITGPGRQYQYLATRPYKDGNTDTLADYAMEYWKKDLRTDLTNNVVPSVQDPAFWQHMVNFMVGLGVRGTLQPDKLAGGVPNPDSDLPALTAGTKTWGTDEIDDLWHSALNSHGEFISAKDPTELAEAIGRSVGQALQRELREAGVATASATLQEGNRKYVPQYSTGSWNGDVKAFVLDANGQAGAQVWSAGAKLPAWSSRNIVTWNTDVTPAAATAFTATDMGASNLTNLGTMTTLPTSTTTDLVNFLRGDRSNEGDGKSFRERKEVLGDFVNSNPVLVKDAVNMGYGALPSDQGGGDTRYADYLTAKAARTATLFVGGNDGMLHAFKDTLGSVIADDGKEVFAYVPKTVVPNLSKLADKDYGTTTLYHQYFVDGPLMETDAFVNAPGAGTSSWRNYLVGSLGAGGRAVFALDVTGAPTLGTSAVRWELNSAANADLGYVTAPIEAGVLPNGEWVAIFGNGGFSSYGKATLFVVNLQTGAARTLDLETSSGSNGLGGVGVVRNTSGQITALYAGDLKGNVWKMNYSASTSSRFEVAGGAAFFKAAHTDGVAQPITQAPLLFDHSKGGKIVLFATGLLAAESDASSTAVQAIYGVWDKTSDSIARPMNRSVLEARSLSTEAGAGGATYYSLSGTAVDWDHGQRGWVINLDLSAGQRVIYPSQKASSNIALVSVVKPVSTVAVCESGSGSGFNLLIPVETGVNPGYALFDTDGNGEINSSDTIVAGYGTSADGVDAIVRGKQECTSEACKTQIYIENTTGSQKVVIRDPGTPEDPRTDPPPTPARVLKDRIWRRIINPPIR